MQVHEGGPQHTYGKPLMSRSDSAGIGRSLGLVVGVHSFGSPRSRLEGSAPSASRARTPRLQACLPIPGMVEKIMNTALCLQLCIMHAQHCRTATADNRENSRVCLGYAGDAIVRARPWTMDRVSIGDNNADLHTEPLAKWSFPKLYGKGSLRRFLSIIFSGGTE